MDTIDAVIYFSTWNVVGFVTGSFFGFLLDSFANSHPLEVAFLYHYILSFIFIAVLFVPVVFARHPGTFSWRHRFPSTEEAFDFIKLLVFWWLVLFMLGVLLEGLALGTFALPYIAGWRQEHCDDPEYIPVSTMLIRAIDGMARDVVVAYREITWLGLRGLLWSGGCVSGCETSLQKDEL
ncbi:uncharacterized protein TrAtP1_001883 [Trichoderma atroviride]|uniref:uncharacterized protein n=1 Tax=Hypocrea atroviridis TaxID=63577 RepID=UPI00332507D0|nr:hypothetical protein TrAtP1_001883 [Trichoderma atroviride]